MPKKQPKDTPEEQSERFRKEAQKLIDDGELNPIEAEAVLNRMFKSLKEKGDQP